MTRFPIIIDHHVVLIEFAHQIIIIMSHEVQLSSWHYISV